MHPLHDHWFNLNRRQMLKGAAAGGLAFLGGPALAQLLAADTASAPRPGGGLPDLPHFGRSA